MITRSPISQVDFSDRNDPKLALAGDAWTKLFGDLGASVALTLVNHKAYIASALSTAGKNMEGGSLRIVNVSSDKYLVLAAQRIEVFTAQGFAAVPNDATVSMSPAFAIIPPLGTYDEEFEDMNGWYFFLTVGVAGSGSDTADAIAYRVF